MNLVLPVKKQYFDEIRSGSKVEEFRLRTRFWIKRIDGQEYDRVIVQLGYPPAHDSTRRIVLPWRGYIIKTITHPHFGEDPVEVFAIKLSDGGEP